VRQLDLERGPPEAAPIVGRPAHQHQNETVRGISAFALARGAMTRFPGIEGKVGGQMRIIETAGTNWPARVAIGLWWGVLAPYRCARLHQG
jgi:hypothetical protein